MKNLNRIKQFMSDRPYASIAVFVVAIIVLAAVIKPLSTKKTNNNSDIPLFNVRQGPLDITITEPGTIKAREQIILKNEIEGSTTILYLIPEGTVVKKGDLLVELDASGLEDEKIEREISVKNAESLFISARENFEIEKNQAQSDTEQAELNLNFAEIDLKKYVEGEYPNLVIEAESKITIAQEEVSRATEKLKWSEYLHKDKYISQTELQADQLAAKQKTLNLELAKNDLDLLENYTHNRKITQLRSDLKQSQMAMERIKRKANANVITSEANLNAKEATYKREQGKLQKTLDQISKARIYAPSEGLVIYATSARGSRGYHGNTEPLEVGQSIRQNTELIYLPTTSASTAMVSIHEASLKKIKIGLSAKVTIDALSGEVLTGKVAKIAPLPNAQNMWLNPDLKVYDSEIYLDSNHSELRTGMSCKVEIIIQQFNNVVYVPIQAVIKIGNQHYVYVVEKGDINLVPVQIGIDNNEMVTILSGLDAGQIVSLAPSLAETGKKLAISDQNELANNEPIQQIALPEETSTNTEDEPMTEDPNEARRKMREKFKNLSPEQREEMRQKLGDGQPRRRPAGDR